MTARGLDRRGGALIVVVAGLALFAALALGGTALMRTGANAVKAEIDTVAARHAAESGAALAIALLVDGDEKSRPPVDGSPIELAIHGARLAVSVSDEAGRIDLNAAPPELLAGAFTAAGMSPDAARRLAAAAVARRRTARFAHLAELHELGNLPSAIFWNAVDALTVHGNAAGLDPRLAPRGALRAVPGLDERSVETYLATRRRVGSGPPGSGRAYFATSPASAYRIAVEAALSGGARHRIMALIRLTQDTKRPYVVLDWR